MAKIFARKVQFEGQRKSPKCQKCSRSDALLHQVVVAEVLDFGGVFAYDAGFHVDGGLNLYKIYVLEVYRFAFPIYGVADFEVVAGFNSRENSVC